MRLDGLLKERACARAVPVLHTCQECREEEEGGRGVGGCRHLAEEFEVRGGLLYLAQGDLQVEKEMVG